MSFNGKQRYLVVKKSYIHAIDNFVTKRCKNKGKSLFKELKATPWKDVDESGSVN